MGSPFTTTNGKVTIPEYPGTYTVTAVNSNNCPANNEPLSVTIDTTDPFVIDVTTVNEALCYGQQGNIHVKILDGVTGRTYTIYLDNVQVATGVAEGQVVIIPASAGTHEISAKDSQGCTATPSEVTVQITQPDELTCSATATRISCYEVHDGTITVTVDGGTQPYQYSLDNVYWQSENIFNDLAAGDYTIYVKDAYDCSCITHATVTQPDELTCSATATRISCYEVHDGTITVTVDGGTQPYQYSLDNVYWQSENIFNDIAAGDYTIYVKDAYDCSCITHATVTQPDELTCSATATRISCYEVHDGTITVTVDGGTQPYQYSLDNVYWQSENIFNDIAAGDYTIYVKDAYDCSCITHATVTQPDELTCSATATRISCYEVHDGTITVTVDGGTQPYQYSL